MEIKIFDLVSGARQAEGLTVVIDVFRAFSLEAYLFARGVSRIYPVGSIEEAFELKEKNPDYILIGERGGLMYPGCDFGNSPASFENLKLYDRAVIHTTSAGTQGIDNAVNADEIIPASFVNAKATARYILEKNPQKVSLVCMGNGGVQPSDEDSLCAEYLKCLLENREPENIEERLLALKETDGKRFFSEDTQDMMPQRDFWMCIRRDIFPFVIKTERENGRNVNRILLVEE
ncbi:MAG: 2-phosphosulfolactate phosphatase [Erysipelotrichaceae bacterium]|nr:2-phosphosulfolactate phosphatase [Erysipelotrichaceae bacterium]MBQ4253339.1 2-phosphosulfolactate phosphatase [Erysipelotrichaceae bacterium]